MNKYYCVQVNDCALRHDKLNLRDHLWYVDRDLYTSDCAFREYFYGDVFSRSDSTSFNEMVEEHNEEFRKKCEEKHIPLNFILIDDGIKLYELATKEEFTEREEIIMDGYKISPEEVYDQYVGNQQYEEEVKDFFKQYRRNKNLVAPIETSEFRNDFKDPDAEDYYESFMK